MYARLPQKSAVDAPLLDEREIAELIAAAPRQVASVGRRAPQAGRIGERLSPRRGSGTDFAEPRPYQPGDDPRRIDWRVSARAGAPLVRTHHAEFSRPSCLVMDRRASMRFGTQHRIKAAQAARVALWLGGHWIRSGEAFSAVLLDAPCHWLPPARGLRALRYLAARVAAPCPPIEADPAEPTWARILTSLRRRLPSGSDLTIASDFAGLRADDLAALRALGRHCDCRAVRIVDAVERHPMAAILPHLVWGEMRLTLDGSAFGAISRRMQDWADFLDKEFGRAGIAYQTLTTDADELSGLAR